jgi:decaprenylphospho-beta-D-erythro-pentofuranosid-2-ulose 2-reductase
MATNKPGNRPTIIILGALSAIAEATARLWAEHHAHLLLAGRDAAKLDAVAADLRLRGAEVEVFAADLAADQAWRAFPEMAKRLGQVDIVLLAYGTLGDQKRAEAELEEAERVLTANFTSAAGWCLAAAKLLEKQKHGTLAVIGSVAGDRGRASNYIYGAAKGGLAVLVQGIAHRLAKAGARAVLIKPGFVDTPMTAHIARKGPLWATPESVGKIIVRAAGQGSSNRTAVYAPGFWRWIMLVIRAIPNSIFHRTKL